MMLAQVAPPVPTPDIVWEGLLPVLILGVGALLLVLFRSVIKALPAVVADNAVPVVGGLTVLAMWIAAGYTAEERRSLFHDTAAEFYDL